MAVGTHSGKEKGAWYEIKTVADNIRLKESLGKDSSFERGLLKSWSTYLGYESAGQALAEIPSNQ